MNEHESHRQDILERRIEAFHTDCMRWIDHLLLHGTYDHETIAALECRVASLESKVSVIWEKLFGVSGLSVSHGTPAPNERVSPMAKFKVSFAKKGSVNALKSSAPLKKAAVGDPAGDFSLQEGTGDVVTVNGVNPAGDVLDISAVATVAAVSDDEAIVTTSNMPPVQYREKAVKAGSANVTITATWNDGSHKPLSFSYPLTAAVDPNNPTGLVITHGTPTPN